jgi:hypothetical protein
LFDEIWKTVSAVFQDPFIFLSPRAIVMAMDARGWGCLLLLVIGLCPLSGQAAQEFPPPELTEPETLIGLTLEELYSRFGVPQALRSVRGEEEWQDDVVLVYPQGDFYVYRDRVWQLAVPSARGIRLGDSREAVILALGKDALEGEDYFILPIRDRSWPMALRVNLGNSAQVAGIFFYRSDF